MQNISYTSGKSCSSFLIKISNLHTNIPTIFAKTHVCLKSSIILWMATSCWTSLGLNRAINFVDNVAHNIIEILPHRIPLIERYYYQDRVVQWSKYLVSETGVAILERLPAAIRKHIMGWPIVLYDHPVPFESFVLFYVYVNLTINFREIFLHFILYPESAENLNVL